MVVVFDKFVDVAVVVVLVLAAAMNGIINDIIDATQFFSQTSYCNRYHNVIHMKYFRQREKLMSFILPRALVCISPRRVISVYITFLILKQVWKKSIM